MSIPPLCREAIDYAEAVASHEIDACTLTRFAVDRFHTDLETMASDGPYTLDHAAAERIMTFVQMMPHIKGPEAGKALHLAPWQKFIYLNIFGWKRRKTGLRRFRAAYTEIPRGNGKSTMVAPAALYMMSADGEGGAEVYSAAVTRDQARIVFNVGKTMAQRRSVYRKRAGVSIFTSAVSQDKTASLFQPLSADARSLDGLNVHFAVLDELAQHKNREVYEVIETATGKRLQPLMWMITTAGPDKGGIGYEIHGYAKQILEGVIEDDSFFSIIYTINPDDDWTSPDVWRKANPNWGISVQPIAIEQLAKKAIQVPSFQNAFQMKHLNRWTNAAVGWMGSVHWGKQARQMKADDFIGEECMIGIDLASKIDVVAVVKIFRRPAIDGSTDHDYFIIPRLYLPEAAVLEGRHANYAGWAAAGAMIKTPGDVVDFKYIEEDLENDFKKYQVIDIPYDPWQATQLAQRMTAKGLPMVEFPATVRNFSEPMKELEIFVRQGRLYHDNNPCYNWMISNVMVQEDRKGNIFPRKDNQKSKIDGPVATIMALARWVYHTQASQSVYENAADEVVI